MQHLPFPKTRRVLASVLWVVVVLVVVADVTPENITITISISIEPGSGSSRADSPPANRQPPTAFWFIYGPYCGVAWPSLSRLSVPLPTFGASARQCEFLSGSFEKLLIRLSMLILIVMQQQQQLLLLNNERPKMASREHPSRGPWRLGLASPRTPNQTS